MAKKIDKDEKEVFEQFEGYFVMPEKAKIFYTDNTSFEGNLQEVYDNLIAKYNIIWYKFIRNLMYFPFWTVGATAVLFLCSKLFH